MIPSFYGWYFRRILVLKGLNDGFSAPWQGSSGDRMVDWLIGRISKEKALCADWGRTCKKTHFSP
jgi:hypothetical protein